MSVIPQILQIIKLVIWTTASLHLVSADHSRSSLTEPALLNCEFIEVKFGLFCGSESAVQVFSKYQDTGVNMSNHRQQFGAPHGQVAMKTKCQLEILRRDNLNEQPWLDSITRWVRSHGAMKFLLKKFNQSRKIDYANDFDGDGPLKKNFVKIEPTEDGRSIVDENVAMEDEAKTEPLFAINHDDLDNTELTMIDQIRIFLDPTKGADAPEDDDSAKLRFKFYDELCKSCPYHASTVKVIIPGDCYDFIVKITRSMVVTNRSKFEHHKRMCLLRWNGSVAHLVNQLLRGQQLAERLKDTSWDDGMMKGALLNICQDHAP
jgi:hypothetical protein